ncbi:hypothetical protein ACFQ07_21540, partial [Actinomadura adrarensis]
MGAWARIGVGLTAVAVVASGTTREHGPGTQSTEPFGDRRDRVSESGTDHSGTRPADEPPRRPGR